MFVYCNAIAACGSNLLWLNLSDCTLKDPGAKELAAILPRLPRLRYLNLSCEESVLRIRACVL
eukprot:m.904265 g.904265  ORF g.904265 m.904265 type:complete len:63 (+) comp60070_c0_seq39:11000-11188(+)